MSVGGPSAEAVPTLLFPIAPPLAMCYDVRQAVETTARTSRVGVRELRQNLSVYLRRIDRGERFEVTDRGRPVALLVPLAAHESPLERLVAQGRASRPERDLLDVRPLAGKPSTAASDALIPERDDRL